MCFSETNHIWNILYTVYIFADVYFCLFTYRIREYDIFQETLRILGIELLHVCSAYEWIAESYHIWNLPYELVNEIFYTAYMEVQ